MGSIVILLFDLAGVLLDFRGIESTWKLSKGTVSAEQFGRFWSKSPVADRYYRGAISPEQFATQTIGEWSLQVTAAQFLEAFRQWLIGPYEGAFELLAGLRMRHTVACLSNTNVLDCERFRSELGLPARFDHCFFSNEIGLRKPELSCYHYVLQQLNTRAADILFFDDNLECVEGARAAGIAAHQCVGIAPLVDTVTRLGLLD
jgi:putative hydrolase of the HAD superfamily